MKDGFMSLKEISELARVDRRKILRKIHSGELRAFNFHKRLYRILKSDLWAYVQRRKKMIKKFGLILILAAMCVFFIGPAHANNEKINRLDDMIQWEYNSQDILYKHILRAEDRLETLEELIQQHRALISDLKLMIDRSYRQIDELDRLKNEALEGARDE